MNEADNIRVFRLAVVFEGGLGLLAWALGWFLERPPLAQIEWSVPAAFWGVLASLPLLAALIAITRVPAGPLRDLNVLVEQLIVPMFRRCALWELALISILAGWGEEMFFRGFVQEGLQELGCRPAVALLSASVLFAVAHLLSMTYAVLAGLIGLYLGGLWLASGNLLTPMVTHAVYDCFALVYLLRGQRVAPKQH